MIREIVLKDFPNWSPEKQLSEYQGYKAMGDFSPFEDSDYVLMEMVMNNPNAEIAVACEDGICEIKTISENQISNNEDILLEANINEKDLLDAVNIIMNDIEELQKEHFPGLNSRFIDAKNEADSIFEFLASGGDADVSNKFLLVSDGTVSIRDGENVRGQHKQATDERVTSLDSVNKTQEAKMSGKIKFSEFKSNGDFEQMVRENPITSIDHEIVDYKLPSPLFIKAVQAFLFTKINDPETGLANMYSLDSNNTDYFEFFQSLGFKEDMPTTADALDALILKYKDDFGFSYASDEKTKYFSKATDISKLFLGSKNAFTKFINPYIKLHDIHFIYGKNLKTYYTHLEKIEDLESGFKKNTSDVVITNVKQHEFLEAMKMANAIEIVADRKPILRIKDTDILFVQISLKASENAQIGKVTSYLTGIFKTGGMKTITDEILNRNTTVNESNDPETIEEAMTFINTMLSKLSDVYKNLKSLVTKAINKTKQLFSEIQDMITNFLKFQEQELDRTYIDIMREVELLKESQHQNILEADEDASASANFFDTFATNKNMYFTAAKTIIANEILDLNTTASKTSGLVRIIQNKEKFFEADEEVSLDDKSTIIKLAANITGLRLLNRILSTIIDNKEHKNIIDSFAAFFAELDAQSKTGATHLPILKVYGGDNDAEIITKAGIVTKTTDDIKNAINNRSKFNNDISPIVIRLNQVNDKDYLSVNLFYIINFEKNEFIYMNMMLRSNTSGTFTFAAENSKTVTLKSIIK